MHIWETQNHTGGQIWGQRTRGGLVHFPAPDRLTRPSRAQRHELTTTLSAEHPCVSSPELLRYIKVMDVCQAMGRSRATYTSHLPPHILAVERVHVESKTDSCSVLLEKTDLFLQISCSTRRSWQSGSSLPQRSSCLRLTGVKTFHFWMVFLWAWRLLGLREGWVLQRKRTNRKRTARRRERSANLRHLSAQSYNNRLWFEVLDGVESTIRRSKGSFTLYAWWTL